MRDMILETSKESYFKFRESDTSYLHFSNMYSGKEILKVEYNKNGTSKIIFNKEEFPQYTSDDFAKEFIDILESHNPLKRVDDV